MGWISGLVNTSTISKTLEDAVPQSFSSNLCKLGMKKREAHHINGSFWCLLCSGSHFFNCHRSLSVIIDLGSWISFSITGSINFLNFSTLRKSMELNVWELNWEPAAQSPWFEVWGAAWCGFVGTPSELFPCDVVTVLLLSCRNEAPGVPRAEPAALSPICHRAESPRAGLVVKHCEAQSHLCSLMSLEGIWRKHFAFEFSLKSWCSCNLNSTGMERENGNGLWSYNSYFSCSQP